MAVGSDSPEWRRAPRPRADQQRHARVAGELGGRRLRQPLQRRRLRKGARLPLVHPLFHTTFDWH
jgi:hypothetical protein